MQRINILLAVPVAQMDGQFIPIRANPDLGAGMPDNVLQTVLNGIEGHWKTVDIDGTSFKLASIIITEGEGPALVAAFSPDGIIMGAWIKDGCQYGTQYTQVENGTDTITVDGNDFTVPHYDRVLTGTPLIPLHPRLLDFMPDEVTYDAAGVETSRTLATTLKEVANIFGWAPREY